MGGAGGKGMPFGMLIGNQYLLAPRLLSG